MLNYKRAVSCTINPLTFLLHSVRNSFKMERSVACLLRYHHCGIVTELIELVIARELRFTSCVR